MAKMMGSLAMVRTMSCVSMPGADTPINTSAPLMTSASVPDCCFAVGDCGDFLLGGVQALASVIDGARRGRS